jgi:hypothetical protein
MVPLKSCFAKNNRKVLHHEEKDSAEDETKRVKGVFFAFVLIREHERILGDHPCVSSGPPISLNWDVENEHMYSLDLYEKARVRRSRNEFLVPESVRVSSCEWNSAHFACGALMISHILLYIPQLDRVAS